MNIPVYEMFLSEQDETNEDFGVFTVSLVDKPAIIAAFMTFSEDSKDLMKFQIVNKEKRIITGAVMIPGMPISRRDEGGIKGEFMVVATRETTERTLMKFMRQGMTGNKGSVNVMHESNMVPEGVFIFEAWLIDHERGTSVPKGFKPCPEGTIFMSMKVDNDELWEDFIKTGIIKGFSIEANYRLRQKPSQDADFLKAVEDHLGSRNA
jgi:hypothetical protein